MIKFVNEEHENFFVETVARLKVQNDPYRVSLVYTLGITDDTRRNWKRCYDEKQGLIKPEAINDGWVTGTDRKVIRLAFNLFTNGTPTAYSEERDDEDVSELLEYTPASLFCNSYAEFFFEAIRLRYPEYTK